VTCKFWATIFTGAVVGAAVAVLCVYAGKLQLEATMTVGNCLQSLATIFIGLLVAWVIQRHIQTDRNEKDILLEYLRGILTAIKEVEGYRQGGKLTEVNAAIKNLRTACSQFRNMLKYLKYPDQVIIEADLAKPIRQIRTIATYTPDSKSQAAALKNKRTNTVSADLLKLAEHNTSLFDTQIQSLKNRVFQLQVKVNKA
jgi:hypothetical protein